MEDQIQHYTTTNRETPQTTSFLLRYGLLAISIAAMLLVGALLFMLDSNNEASSSPAMTDETVEDVLFLGPADAARVNLFRLELETGNIRRLTNTEGGIQGYAISPNHKWVAYTVQVTGQLSDIWALNLETGQEIQLTNCREAEASCSTPSWRYDSAVVAYTRRELNAEGGWENTERVWLVDLQSRESRPLFDDVDTVARFPVWSPTDERIAISLIDPPGIVVYDLPTDELVFVASPQGITGRFTADGEALLYPATRFGEAVQYYYTHIEMIVFGENFSENTSSIRRVSGEPTLPVTDGQAVLHPDGERVAVTRRYLDDRFTEGSQIYLLNVNTDTVEPLIVDAAYAHAALSWNTDGTKLLYQRTNLSNYSEIDLWVYDLENRTSTRIYDNGFMPRFLND